MNTAATYLVRVTLKGDVGFLAFGYSLDGRESFSLTPSPNGGDVVRCDKARAERLAARVASRFDSAEAVAA